ncbi:MAG: hypothetical protein AAFP84_01675 [Actinomycetota bacterium]
MNDQLTHDIDDALRAAADGIHRRAPEPRAWDDLLPRGSFEQPPRNVDASRRVLAFAAAAIVLVALGGLVAVVGGSDGSDPRTPGAPLPPVTTAGEVEPTGPEIDADRRPLDIVRPTLAADADAIAVAPDVELSDRWLAPNAPPEGFTLDYAFRSDDPSSTSSRYLSTDPSITHDEQFLLLEISRGSLSAEDSTAFTTDSGVEWQHRWGGSSNAAGSAEAFLQAPEWFATVRLALPDLTEATYLDELAPILDSLRLVAESDLGHPVVDLGDVPVLARTPDDAERSGVLRLARSINAWCVVTGAGNGGGMGCGLRFDPALDVVEVTDQFWDDDGRVTVAGLAAPAVATVELDFAGGSTIALRPENRADDAPELAGINGWIGTTQVPGSAFDDLFVGGRALAADGTVLATFGQS